LIAIIRHAAFIPARGMALFPFILVKYPQDLTNARLIRHEYIHIWQQIELLIIPFYLLYLLNYFWNRIKGLGHHEAYLNIYFEKEAFMNDDDEEYLLKRRLWSSFKYIHKKSSLY
jgi:hypothetical protein